MIKFNRNSLIINNKIFEMKYIIDDIKILENQIIVLFDYSCKEKQSSFNNVVAISKNGLELWKVELPTEENMDSYYQINLENGKLIASSVCSYECEIDLNTGKILKKTFYK